MEVWFDRLAPFLVHGSYFGVFLTLVLCGVGLPVPEEITFIAAGYIVAEIDGSLGTMILFGMVGILIGDTIIYFLGKRYGFEILNFRPFRYVFGKAGLQRAQQFFDQHGTKAAFLAGFFAGIRATTFFVCGTMRVSYWTFIFLDFVRAALTCPISIYLGYRFGRDAVAILAHYKGYALGGLAVVVLLLALRHFWANRAAKNVETETSGPSSPPQE